MDTRMETDGDCHQPKEVRRWKDEAMENELVLQKLFTFLTVPELKTIQEVCSLWRVLATPGLYARTFCAVLSDEGHWNDLSRFMAEAEKYPHMKPMNFRFSYMNLTDKNMEKTRIVEFFERFGKTVVRLQLRRCCLDKTGQFWTNLVRISKWTPNLQELILDENTFIRGDTEDGWGLPSRHRITSLRLLSDKSDGAMPCNLSKIWKEFPFLETLQLVDLTEEENLVILESTNPGKLKSSKPKLYLKDLDIFGEKEYSVRELPRNQLKLFCEMRVPLVKLTIDIGEHILAGNFQQLLLAYGPTLKELIMWRGLLANKMKEPGFPYGVELPKLEYLEVPESCLINFNFIHHVPALLNLTVRQCDLNPIPYETDLFNFRYSYKEWRAFIQNQHKALREIKVEFKVNDENIEFMRGIFPNLRLFTGFVNQELVIMPF